jgi:hypothetical protein
MNMNTIMIQLIKMQYLKYLNELLKIILNV